MCAMSKRNEAERAHESAWEYSFVLQVENGGDALERHADFMANFKVFIAKLKKALKL